MAQATKTTALVEEVVKTTKKVDVVLLELNEAEAKVLRLILGRVGGLPNKSLRGHSENIFMALNKAGVAWDYQHTNLSGYMTFGDGIPPGYEYPGTAPAQPLKPTTGARIRMLEDFPEHGRGIKKGTDGWITEVNLDEGTYRIQFTYGGPKLWLSAKRFEVLPS